MHIRGSVKVFSSSIMVCVAASFLLVAGTYFAKDSSLPRKSGSALGTAHNVLSSAPKRDNSKALETFGKLPLAFVENQGQTAQEVRYLSHGAGYDLFLTSQEAVVNLRQGKHPDLSPRHRFQSLKAMHGLRRSAPTTTALRMQFEGANLQAQIAGEEKLPGAVNYFIGSDSRKWHGGVPTYAQVKYTQVYPGVDLVFYGNQNKLEYDFVVAPGADPNVIRLSLSGAKKMRVNSSGDVLLTVPGGEVALQKPLVYQNINGQRRKIAGSYAIQGSHVSFAVASYDRREPLIVDPILNYSTYVGGGNDDSTGYGIAVDTNGNAYISGQTFSTDFPTKNALTPAAGVNAGNTSGQGFVTEISTSGAVVFSTYLGGSAGGDAAFGIALDPSGNIYVTGETVSTDFPTLNGFKNSVTSNTLGDSFLTKLSNAGAIVYSTYIGGTNNDFGNAVAADASGNAYVTGTTSSSPGTGSTNFPVTDNAVQTNIENSDGAAFLTRIDTTQIGNASLIYSTYLGGDDAYEGASGLVDEGFGIVVDTAQHAFLGGATASSDFPTNGTVAAQQTAPANAIVSAFVAEIDTTPTGGSLLYSSYLGGTGGSGFGDFGTGVDLQSGTTNLCITGVTNSGDFPTTSGAYQTTGDTNLGAAFVTITDTSSGKLKYSTYLGAGGTTGWSIKADTLTPNIVVGGATDFASLPTTKGAYQTSLASGAPGDGFIAEIDPAGNQLEDLGYLTYFGGSGSGGNPDQIFGIAIGTLPTVYIAGQTFSTNLPSTTGNTLGGASDAFVASLDLTAPALSFSASTVTLTSTAVGTASPTQTLTLTNNTNSPISFTSATATTTTPAGATDFSATTACTVIPALSSCTIVVGFTPTVATAEAGTLTIVDGAGTQMIPLSGSIAAPVPGFNLTITPTGTLTVKKGSSGMVTINVNPVNGFTGTVTLTCTGEPKHSTCAISPASVTPAGGIAATSTLTFTTNTKSTQLLPVMPRVPTNTIRVVAPVALMLLLVILFASEQRLRTRLAMAGALLIFIALAGCGSSGTPKGSYSLTVTGTSGAVTETVTVPVVVD